MSSESCRSRRTGGEAGPSFDGPASSRPSRRETSQRARVHAGRALRRPKRPSADNARAGRADQQLNAPIPDPLRAFVRHSARLADRHPTGAGTLPAPLRAPFRAGSRVRAGQACACRASVRAWRALRRPKRRSTANLHAGRADQRLDAPISGRSGSSSVIAHAWSAGIERAQTRAGRGRRHPTGAGTCRARARAGHGPLSCSR